VTARRVLRFLLFLVCLPPAVALSSTDAAATPPLRPREWPELRAEWTRAKREYETARWGGSLDGILSSLDRAASAESAYVSALSGWCAESARSAPPAGSRNRAGLRRAALDLLERGRVEDAIAILSGPLRDDRGMLPVQARAVGMRGDPDSGLTLLAWPPDRRLDGPRAILWDAQGRAPEDGAAAAYVAAAALSDSAGNRRAARAALWRLLAGTRPAERGYARPRLARALLEGGEPRLVTALLERARGMDDDEELLLANLRADLAASLGDTVGGIQILATTAADSKLGTAQRHAAAKSAAEWTRAGRADSLPEAVWLSLVKSLGDVGESSAALSLLTRRRVAAPDSTAALARAETDAALLARARRNRDAALAYERLLARADLPDATRAKDALGLARARRGLGEFAPSDSAFVLATTLDPGSPTAELAAWERAREWESRKSPRETAEIFTWAIARIRDVRLLEAARVHRAIAWLRAGEADSASASLSGRGPKTAEFWRGEIQLAQGDSARARDSLARVGLADPWSYEEARAREELAGMGVPPGVAEGAPGSPVVTSSPASRASTAGDADAPFAARLLGAVGAPGLMTDALRECSQKDGDSQARDCTEALEDLGLFRVGRSGNVPWPRLEYPPAYARAAARAADRESLSAALLWAIMRQESGYRAAVRSKAGAIGLMQLLPSTASRLAKSTVTESALTDPERNLELGARYLRELTREFGDPRAVMAAYNAGEDAVRRWLRERPRVDDVWVELIPYRETRDYVKQVYAAWRRYESIYAPPSRG
jgi:soluble lytic murein transglycosylase